MARTHFPVGLPAENLVEFFVELSRIVHLVPHLSNASFEIEATIAFRSVAIIYRLSRPSFPQAQGRVRRLMEAPWQKCSGPRSRTSARDRAPLTR